MASWIDTKTPVFNPYIQQMPVNEMVAVGTQKQQQYDQGVQKIQTQIDNIAGLDVIRDVDKQYLQSKLNTLGNRLKTVAAGDFSNFQLVNSVSGMTTHIAKDPSVINAVSSTARYRKGVSQLDDDNKQGKGSPSNTWDFYDQANKWLNNNDVNSSFNGNYQSYTNYKKNSLEVIKSLTKDSSITDDAFTIDNKGKLAITDAVVRKKLEGISPEKIQQALIAGLTPADFKQMEIDGRYMYSNTDPKTFMNTIITSHQEQENAFGKQKQTLSSMLDQTTSAVEKANIKEQISEVDKHLSRINSEYKNISSTFETGDVESAKARLHTTNFMNSFAGAFSYTQTSQTMLPSALADMQMRREIKNQDWKKFMVQNEQAERHFMANYLQKQELIDLKKKAGGMNTGGLPRPIPQEDLPQYTLDKIKQEVTDNQLQLATDDYKFIQQHGKDQQWLDEQRKAWLERPTGVTPIIAEHFESTEARRRQLNADVTMVTQINNDAIKKFGDIYSTIPQGSPSASINGIIYSPKEIVDLNSNISKYIKVSTSGSTGGGGVNVNYDDEKAKNELGPKGYKVFEVYKKSDRGQPLTDEERNLINVSQQYMRTINVPYQSKLEEINKYTSEEVSKRVSVSQGVDYSISTANPALRDMAAGNLLKFINRAEEQGGIAESPDFDTKQAKAIATDSQAKYTIKVIEGTQYQPARYQVTAIGSKGETVKFKVDANDKQYVWGNEFEPSLQVRMIRPYQEQIRKMGGYSTAVDPGRTSVNNSYLNKTDFPRVSIFGISGNIVTPNNGKTYSIELNIYDPITKTWHENIPYPRTGLITEEKLAEAMTSLDDKALYELIHEKVPTAADLIGVKNASKKP